MKRTATTSTSKQANSSWTLFCVTVAESNNGVAFGNSGQLDLNQCRKSEARWLPVDGSLIELYIFILICFFICSKIKIKFGLLNPELLRVKCIANSFYSTFLIFLLFIFTFSSTSVAAFPFPNLNIPIKCEVFQRKHLQIAVVLCKHFRIIAFILKRTNRNAAGESNNICLQQVPFLIWSRISSAVFMLARLLSSFFCISLLPTVVFNFSIFKNRIRMRRWWRFGPPRLINGSCLRLR